MNHRDLNALQVRALGFAINSTVPSFKSKYSKALRQELRKEGERAIGEFTAYSIVAMSEIDDEIRKLQEKRDEVRNGL